MILNFTRLFVLLSGIAHVTLPSKPDDEGLWIMQSANSVIVAVDTEGPGHVTEYPADVESVALQIPFEGGRIPEYEVLHEGVCAVGKQWEGMVKGTFQEEHGAQSIIRR